MPYYHKPRQLIWSTLNTKLNQIKNTVISLTTIPLSKRQEVILNRLRIVNIWRNSYGQTNNLPLPKLQ